MYFSPAIVANLWDVTGKDIDKYLEAVLGNWFTTMEDRPLSAVVTASRKVCKMPYINGAAPICYGVPVTLKKAPLWDCLLGNDSEEEENTKTSKKVRKPLSTRKAKR